MDTTIFSPPVSYTFNLAPGESQAKDGEFVFVRAISANGAFNLGLDLGKPFGFSVGLGFETLPGQIFRRITIENPATATGAITVTIVAGRMRLHDDRLNILVGSSYLPTTEPATQFVGQNIISLAAGTNKILTGVAGAGQYRRSGVTVDNLDAALALTLYDAAAGIAGYVLPGSSRYIPLSGYLKVSNDNGGAVACAIGEIWQLSP